METNSMIDGEKFVGLVFEKDVSAFTVGIVDEKIKERQRAQELFVVAREVEVVIIRIVFDELLQRTRSMWTIPTERCKWDDVKAKRLADKIGSNLAQGECVFGEIPERLLAATRFVNGRIYGTFMMNFHKEGVV